jgi:extracellular elastinolytic metalloproteinase
VVSFDALTGNPAELLGAAPPAGPGDYVQRALDYLGGFHDTLGFAPTQPTEFEPDPHVQVTSSGAAAVHLQQLYKGIPIFQANQAVQFNPQGGIEGTLGQSISVEQEQDPRPAIGADTATMIAARYIAEPQAGVEPDRDQFGQPLQSPTLDLSGYVPAIINRDDTRADQRTRLSPGPFAEPPQAALVWFYDDPALILAWEALFTLPAYSEQYRVLVDAVTGELLYCHQLVHHIAAQANVYLRHGDEPRRFVDFPLPPASYQLSPGAPLPPGFPGDWVDGDIADGNNVYAHFDDDGPTVGGTMNNGIVIFNPRLPNGNAQRILNLFYYVNRMHNFFYLLGFREADGNFQVRNTSPGGLPGDAVDARVYAGFVNGTATMTTPIDGSSPVMRMGSVASPLGQRHTALDASVVYHEYAHGVTNRLVGGPLNVRAMDAVQSQALGEGLSDFFACIATESTVVGAWVMARAVGIRSAPYDSHYPGNFGDLGQGRYREIHSAGEIWCAALMELSRMIDKALCLHLVMDALRLMPANPSFLQARDAILRALDHMAGADKITAATYSTARAAAWRAFARFGMGPNAHTPHAFTLNGVIGDTSEPAFAADDSAMNAPEPPQSAPIDDFSRLPELDERSERKLHTAGILSFADLAQRTPAQLARIIAKAGFNADRIKQLGWVQTARTLAGEQSTTQADSASTEPADERQRTTSFTVRLNIRADGQVRKLEIVHVRDGAHDEWDGWNEPELLAFIRRHAGIHGTTDAMTARTGATQRLPEPRAALPSELPAPHHAHAQARLSGETVAQPEGDDQLRVQLQFEVVGEVGAAQYIWQVLARHRDTGKVEVLATQEGALDPLSREHQVSAVVDLPKTDGLFRLSGILRIPEQAIFLEVPGPPLSVEAS